MTSRSLMKLYKEKMDEIMCGERGWRELTIMGDTMEQINNIIEGFIWHKYHAEKHDAENKEQNDDWTLEKGPHSDFEGPKYGSTACVAVVRGNQLIVANAGDFRCVISRNGQAFNMSKEHKPELKTEKDKIYAAGGYIYGGRVNRTQNLAEQLEIQN